MWQRLRNPVLVRCLFLFLLVVLGGGLHLSPGVALLAAICGTPLIVHLATRNRHAGPGAGTKSEDVGILRRQLMEAYRIVMAVLCGNASSTRSRIAR
jgi:hypothetical protein